MGIFWNRKNRVASQWTDSGQKQNNYSGKNFPLGNIIFLEIMESYDDEKMWEKFGNLLIIQTIGCFTTHSEDKHFQGENELFRKNKN